MTKIECILSPGRLEAVKDALGKFGIHGMTASEVIGCGLQKGKTKVAQDIGCTITLLPKVKIEIVLQDSLVDEVINIFVNTSRTGQIGDGKIFVHHIENVIRIRTGESGEAAL